MVHFIKIQKMPFRKIMIFYGLIYMKTCMEKQAQWLIWALGTDGQIYVQIKNIFWVITNLNNFFKHV